MSRIRKTATSFVTSSSGGSAAKELAEKVVDTCQAVHANDLERNKEMSRLGADWLFERRKGGDSQKKLRVMTVSKQLLRYLC